MHHHHCPTTTYSAPTRSDLAHLLSPAYLPSQSSSKRIYKDSTGIAHDPSFSLFPSEADYSRRRSFDSQRTNVVDDEEDYFAQEEKKFGGYPLSIPPSPTPSTSYLSTASSSASTAGPSTPNTNSSPRSPLRRLFSRHHDTHAVYEEDAFWEGDEEDAIDIEEEEEYEEYPYPYYTEQPIAQDDSTSSQIGSTTSPQPHSLRRRVQYLQLAVQLGVFRASRKLRTNRKTLSF